jgi:hypothetical protein
MRMLKSSFSVVAGSVALLATAVPAWAQPYPPVVEVSPTVVTQGGEGAGVGPAVEAGAQGAGGGLAFTGAEIGLLVLAAGLLAAIGAMALIAARRRRALAA